MRAVYLVPQFVAVWFITAEFIWINWDGKPSGYAEIPDNWIFLRK